MGRRRMKIKEEGCCSVPHGGRLCEAMTFPIVKKSSNGRRDEERPARAMMMMMLLLLAPDPTLTPGKPQRGPDRRGPRPDASVSAEQQENGETTGDTRAPRSKRGQLWESRSRAAPRTTTLCATPRRVEQARQSSRPTILICLRSRWPAGVAHDDPTARTPSRGHVLYYYWTSREIAKG